MKRSLLIVLPLVVLFFVLSAAGQPKTKKITTGEAKTIVPANVRNTSLSTGSAPKVQATSSGDFYDVDPATGASSNPRQPKLNGLTVHLAGITRDNNTVWGLSTSVQPQQANQCRLVAINPALNTITGGPTLQRAGNQVFCQSEGDVAYDKTAGVLYASCLDSGVWTLYTINTSTGALTFKGTFPAGSCYAGLAFSPDGKLYALDTVQKRLWKLDKNNAASSPMLIPLVPAPGQQLPNTSQSGSMGFTDAGGVLASFGGDFVSINPTTGAVAKISPAAYSGILVSGGGVTKLPQ